MIAAITAIVKMHTNFPGLVMMVKMLTREIKRRRAQIPNEMKALDIFFSVGRCENSFPKKPAGGAGAGVGSDLLKNDSTPDLDVDEEAVELFICTVPLMCCDSRSVDLD